MTDLERLNSKLAKLKSDEDAAEQTVAGGTEGIIAILLAEIEETILPREMVLTDESGTEFRLLVAGRRLLRVDGGSSPAPAPAGDPADAVAAAFRGPFRRFLDRAQEVGIAAGRPTGRVDPTEIGCSVEALAAPAAPADPVSACLDLCRAGLRLGRADGAEPVGEPDLVLRLLQFAESGLPALAPVAGGSGARLTILRAARAEDLLLAHVVTEEAAALLLAPPTAQADLLAICRAAPAA